MIAALCLGRKGSTAFPGKNVYPVLGRKMSYYSLMGAKNATQVDKVYLSTDCEELMELAESLDVEVIKRPDYLATKEALGDDAYKHGYEEIKKRNPNEKLELLVLIFCNAPTYTPAMVDEGIAAMRAKPELDSAVSVSQMNWYSPIRARRIMEDGLLQPYIPFENYPEGMGGEINCDRNRQIDCYFADVCISVIRPENLDKLEQGMLPQKWMGQKIYPIHNQGGLDIDEDWQLPLIEGWLRKNGFTENETPYDK
jgi:hypothetical protein